MYIIEYNDTKNNNKGVLDNKYFETFISAIDYVHKQLTTEEIVINNKMLRRNLIKNNEFYSNKYIYTIISLER